MRFVLIVLISAICAAAQAQTIFRSVMPDGRVVFVSLWFSDAVAAIDINTRKVLTNIQFARGSGPKRILVAPRVS